MHTLNSRDRKSCKNLTTTSTLQSSSNMSRATKVRSLFFSFVIYSKQRRFLIKEFLWNWTIATDTSYSSIRELSTWSIIIPLCKFLLRVCFFRQVHSGNCVIIKFIIFGWNSVVSGWKLSRQTLIYSASLDK